MCAAWCQAPRVAAHRDQAAVPLARDDGLRVGQPVGERNLHLHVLAGVQAGQRLRGVHLRGRAQDHRVDVAARQALGQVGRDVADAVLARHLGGLVELAADQRDNLDAVDQPHGVQMLEAEGAGPGQRDLDRHSSFSRMRWPTAVFDAGTW